MNYSDEFKKLIHDEYCPNFVGWGNPNAGILILGKEPAIDMNSEHGKIQYKIEVENNRKDWQDNIANHIGFDEVFNKHSKSRLYGNPLWPHCWQKYQVKKRVNGILPEGDGTSRTWYQYQKLINMIIGRESARNDSLDFHKYCFSTDLSDIAKLSSGRMSLDTSNAIGKRCFDLFYTDFFRHFKIIIAAIGNYQKNTYWNSDDSAYNWNDLIEKFFSAGYEPKCETKVGGSKFVVHEDDKFIASAGTNYGRHLVITTNQLSATISDDYLRKIADIIIDFAKRENINLIPEM